MSDVNVLVLFSSRDGRAEQLGLAAGLGAIQAKGNIRLRRVADLAASTMLDATPESREHVERMNRDYVAPRPADPVWADVLVLATASDSPAEIETYCASLASFGPMAGKIAAALAPGGSRSLLAPVYAAAASAGLIVVPHCARADDDTAVARAQGQRVVRMARALKQSPPALSVEITDDSH